MNVRRYCDRCKTTHYFYHQASPVYRATWQQMVVDGAKDVAEVILGMVVLLALFLGIPFLLWVIAGGLS